MTRDELQNKLYTIVEKSRQATILEDRCRFIEADKYNKYIDKLILEILDWFDEVQKVEEK